MDKTQGSPELSREKQVPANPPPGKRQIDGNSDAEPLIKRARPTRKNLALLDNMGKKKTPDPTDDSKSAKSTLTTTTGFADKAYKNGTLRPLHSRPPVNLDDIDRRHAASRATASPPQSVYKAYSNRVGKAGNEATVVVETSGKLLKEYDDDGYNRAFNRAFINITLNSGYNDGLLTPQPDFVEGLEKQEFRPFKVAEYIPGAAFY
ncbi:hypothetical protein SCUCBS95973_005084 [Sporothrix curviconia]|uniref:Uncharacterized protein n=1 Tax=Sporothrix curviconia TaxID=1260050 RepID=A0ABP0BVR2_9PEZI